jgi:superfamily II DNA or RNA helicase
MFKAVTTTAQRKLWPHQVAALKFAIEHLNSLESPFLIRMPTGTGKTGVIACLTRLSNSGSSLVLTPWAHLRDQMIDDVQGDFWKKVDLAPETAKVVPMLPSSAEEVLEASGRRVIVATFATLNQLRLNREDLYKSLAKTIDLVIVDEGHYEPAVQWSKSVKGLNRRTVLLTATPYRNDLKLFRIHDTARSAHHFTHKDAVDAGIIRGLALSELSSPTDIPSLCSAFGRRWKDLKRSGSLPAAKPRAIICCSGATDISRAVALLRDAGIRAIGIHEQFVGSKNPHLLKEVPDPATTDAELWVHQYKLMEGLDDHRFSCIALFARIGNDRKLIQQIGRILRRDSNDRDTPAILLAPTPYSVDDEWNAYLEFETNLPLLDPDHFSRVVQALLSNQPPVEYFEGRFRRRFDPSALTVSPEVIISPSVLVRVAAPKFSLDQYIEDCTDTLNTNDAVILGPTPDTPCARSKQSALWVYATVKNSGLLHSTSLYEVSLATHCVVLAHGYILITDTRGIYPDDYIEETTSGAPVGQLVRFLDARFRPTHVSVDSSVPYDTVLRGIEMHGHNLLSIPASLTDRIHICRSARGSSKADGRRYVGLYNGRVRKEATQEERRNFDLSKFVSWAEDAAAIMKSRVTSSPVFKRYMPTCDPPRDLVPKTLCVDLFGADLSLTLPSGAECRLTNSSSEIVRSGAGADGPFKCSFGLESESLANASTSLSLDYQEKSKRFFFKMAEGLRVNVTFEDERGSSTKSLAEFLNQKQEVILIGLEGGSVVYQGRNFYHIDYTYAEQVLVNLITRESTFAHCETEKGSEEEILALKRNRGRKFARGSIFRAVVDRRIGLPFDDELLVCDDLGTECADFVAANFKSRQLALIHAKAGTGTKISASAFHDVVAQAMKNLVYLTNRAEIPKGIDSWRKSAKWNGTNISRICRSKNGIPSGERLWNKLTSEIINSSRPELYVVLATTGCCDLDALTKAVSDPDLRTPEVAQLVQLLDVLNNYTRQLGVQLVLSDLPYEE